MARLVKPLCALALLGAGLGTPPAAHGWGMATHAYIADHLGHPRGGKNREEIYSAMLPDLFNAAFDLPDYDALYDLTHQPATCLAPWQLARRKKEKASGFGFACHNDAFGADAVAHHAGRTVGLDDGYVITKAQALLAAHPLPPALDIPEPVARSLAHGIVEFAIDLLVERLDPDIGRKVNKAAARRSRRTPRLLVAALAPPLAVYAGSEEDAAALLLESEKAFRDLVRLYGYALMLGDEATESLLVDALVEQADAYLAAQGASPLPPAVTESLVRQYLAAAQALCEPDYAEELAATIEFVDRQLRAHGIEY